MESPNASLDITGSVGLRGANRAADVITVQKLLNRNRHRLEERLEIPVDGVAGPATIEAIQRFQKAVMHMNRPDGRVDPDGPTLAALNAFHDEVGSSHAKQLRAPAEGPLLAQPILFPLRKRPALSYAYSPNADHHRYFGARRTTKSGGYRAHAACDLIAPVGSEILAIDDGEILRDMYYFYENTNALEVRHNNGLVARYGEISSTAPGLRKGSRVKRGQVIASVGKLSSGSHMLHFELYTGALKGSLTCPGNMFRRRGDLIDPTDYLDRAILA